MVEIGTHNHLPTVESPRGILVPLGFTDIDGTAIDETIPENQRLATIGPARESFRTLEQSGLQVGVITGRALGEAVYFQNEMNTHGPIICEDGAVVVLPTQVNRLALPQDWGVTDHLGRACVVLSRVTSREINAFLAEAREESGEAMIASNWSSAEDLLSQIPFPSREAAVNSAARLASAFVVNPTETQAQLIAAQAQQRGIRTFGVPLHLIPADADKGAALAFINKNAGIIFQGQTNQAVSGILPVAWGNNDNDLKLFPALHQLGGIGVIVGKPGGGYFVDEQAIPDYVIKAHQPYGLGISETLPQVQAWLTQQLSNNS